MSGSSRDGSASCGPAREAEFAAFHKENFRKLSNYAARFSSGRVDGDDIASEALLSIYKTWDTVPPEHRTATVYTITRRKTISELRREASLGKALQLIRNSKPDRWQPDLGQRMELEQTWAAIDQLPAKHREVLLLHLNGMPDNDIATVMNIKKRTVATYLAKARHGLTLIVGNVERRQRAAGRGRSSLTSEGGRTS